MKTVRRVDEIINPSIIKPGSVVYASGNAGTPQVLLGQLAADLSIKEVDLFSILLLGDRLKPLFSEERCRELTHRVIFNSYLSREAVNHGWAKYHAMHLSEVPTNLRRKRGVDVVLLSVSGPDPGGNYSLGTTVEAVEAAIETVRDKRGLVIAERNAQMPFVLGTTIPGSFIDYLVESDYPLPPGPVHRPDAAAMRIGEIIASLYIVDGSGNEPGSTLQYGIGEVPEAVTSAILRKGLRDLGIHTELFADGMRRLVQAGVVTNRWKKNVRFSVSSIFLAEDQKGYNWLHQNSSVQSRPSDYTNSVFKIAEQPRMVCINSAIGVDLHGNIWADSLEASRIYSGVGGQSDFIRGARYSEGGVAIIALKSTTSDGRSKIIDKAPPGITATATPSDNVIIVTEQGAFDPTRRSLGERAVGIAHLASPDARERLLKYIHDSPAYHKPQLNSTGDIRGFTPYEEAVRRA
ncbi:MAG TPA: acetyl-CoA hydrolase/transferase C-terminal domain-containing protein [Candidatus Deferrimicrobium sp.]|nr:acetyl-CoA hydrolase/transferase C-terminal domain-containing protein [Candidatus Deferrimicrobium sp.]